MKKYFLTMLCVLFFSGTGFADEQVIAQRKAVLKALEKVKASTTLNYSQYMESLSNAIMEENILFRMKSTDTDGALCDWTLSTCVLSYKLAGGAWNSEMESYGYDSIAVINSRANLIELKRKFWKDGKEKLDEAYNKCFP